MAGAYPVLLGSEAYDIYIRMRTVNPRRRKTHLMHRVNHRVDTSSRIPHILVVLVVHRMLLLLFLRVLRWRPVDHPHSTDPYKEREHVRARRWWRGERCLDAHREFGHEHGRIYSVCGERGGRRW